jgi:hypothetical protein
MKEGREEKAQRPRNVNVCDVDEAKDVTAPKHNSPFR